MILQYENFLTQEDYLVLRNFIENSNDWQKQKSPLWDRRIVNIFNIDIQRTEVFNVISKLHDMTKNEINNHFNVEGELHSDQIQFQRTFPQPDAPPHSDSTDNDGNYNGTSHRKFSSLLYLNDQFTGGNLWFPNQNVEVEPKPNKLILFPSTFEYMHGVKAVTSGVRYSILEFWEYGSKDTFCESVLNRWRSNG
jgi:predicted 2-oxoglutarate/Fe(II)-dependent dioxygenase YbiX